MVTRSKLPRDGKMSRMTDRSTRILLVRHGATVASADDKFAGSTDVDLSPDGLQQAKALGRRLRQVHIDAAYCSPMHRAMITAESILSQRKISATQMPELREIDHGHWEGVVHKEVEKKYAAEYAAWSADPVNT